MLHALSVDVEEHFQVSAFAGTVGEENWEQFPSRVEHNTRELLDLFDARRVTATFFVLGWIGEKHPRLVREIYERGHEVANHGYAHRLVYRQTTEEFRRDIVRTRQILEDAAGCAVEGYRAASFSIGRRNLWALEVLAEEGFRYDSSLFPVVHDRYGIPGSPRHIYRLVTTAGASLVEVPPSTIRAAGLTLPVAGGGYLRLYPFGLTRWAIRRLATKERAPAVVYVHPWEIDPRQPRVDGLPWRSKFRHYVNLTKTFGRLDRLLQLHRFASMRSVIESLGDLPAVTVSDWSSA